MVEGLKENGWVSEGQPVEPWPKPGSKGFVMRPRPTRSLRRTNASALLAYALSLRFGTPYARVTRQVWSLRGVKQKRRAAPFSLQG